MANVKSIQNRIEELNRLSQKAGGVMYTNQDDVPTVKEQNSGSGALYALEKAGLGLLKGVEGATDFIVGGIGALFGADEFAENLMKNDWVNYSHAEEWYNPGEGWQLAGDIAGGVGSMLPSIAITVATAGAGGAVAAAGATAGTAQVVSSAAGQATSEKVKESGQLTGKEWAYGAASGALEGAIEKASGGIAGSKAGKVFGKQFGKTALSKVGIGMLGEGAEEAASTIIDPVLQRVTGVNQNAEAATLGEIGRSALVGGAVGGIIGGASTSINAARSGGYNNLAAAETAQQLQQEQAGANKRQSSGKKEDRLSSSLIQDAANTLSTRLQKMDDGTRQQFLENHRDLSYMFNEDGTLVEGAVPTQTEAVGRAMKQIKADKQTLRVGDVKVETSTDSGNYNTDSYSASLRGFEGNLKYKPISADSKTTNVAKDVMTTLTKLTDGKANIVLTEDVLTAENGEKLVGWYQDGVIYLDATATDYDKALFTGVHEVVHSLEGTKEYNELAEFIAETISNSPALQGKYGYDKYRAVYDSILSGDWSEVTKDYQASTEIFADFVANEIANNPNMVRNIVARNKGILTRLLNWVRNAIIKLGDSKQERAMRKDLTKLEKLLADALEAGTGGRTLEQVDRDARAAEKARMLEEVKSGDTVDAEGDTEVVAKNATTEEPSTVEGDDTPKALTEEQAVKRGIIDKKGGTIRYNLFTFDNGGKQQLESNLKKNGFTKSEINETVKTMQDMADYFRILEADIAGLVDWNSARVLYDAKTGKNVFSAMVKNGDYPLNIDLSTICKKRKALTKVLNTLVKKGYIDTVDLSAENLVKINEILRKYNYEVACPACFVETKRYRVDDWANKFLDPWNELIKNAVPNAQTLDFANGVYSVEGAQVDVDYLNRVIKEHTKVNENGRRSKDSIAKMAQRILEDESVRGYLNKSDMIGSIGLEKMKQYQSKLYSLVLQKGGTSTPKIIQEVQPYNGELGIQKQLAKRAGDVGGVRMFSFSDFTVQQTFDYLQVAADLASQKATMQTYTKEITFAELFGQTGMKINLSMIPAIDKSVGKDSAGLNAQGEAIYSKDWGVNYNDAKTLMNKEGYSGNVGTATIGISKNHILKLLDDPVTNYIIPYHKSSLNPTLAKMMDIDWYTDYTTVQNTRNSSGEKISATEAKKFNFFKELANAKDARKMAQNYLEWCKKNNYIPKFDEFAWHPNYYKLLVDFQVYQTVDGKEVYAPQNPVQMKFPDNFKEILKTELKGQEELDAKRDVNFEKVMDETLQVLKKSTGRASIDVDNAYLNAVNNGDIKTAQEMVDEAARKAGYNTETLYHGTRAFGFTEIKTRGIDKYAWSPFFATNNPNIATTYSGEVGAREIGKEKLSKWDEHRGNYKLYGNTDNFLVIDGKGAEWDNIDSEYGKKTRVIARNALNKGYSGVLLKNIVDQGLEWNDVLNDVYDYNSDVYIFFKPETQVKSADPITYDNNGEVIPISERFKNNKSDIRFSLDVDLMSKTSNRVQTVVHKESVKEIWDRVMEDLKYGSRNKWIEMQISLTDEQAGIVQAGKNLGLNINGEIQRARSAKAAAVNMITFKQTDYNGNVIGESLRDIFKPIQQKGEKYAKSFNEYLLHQLNVDRMSAVERGLAEDTKPVFEEKVDKDFSLKRVQELEEQFPSFKETAEKVWKYSKNLLQYRVDAGLITQAQADQMNNLYPHYVPAYYDATKVASAGIGAGKSAIAVRTGIKAAKGSSGKADLIDVSVSLSKQTESVVRAAAINKLVTKLYDKAVETKTFIDLDVAEKEMVNDPDVNYDDHVTKDNQITFYKDGERITLDISEYMYAGFEGLGAYSKSDISPLESVASRWMDTFKKWVTSANPFFTIRNAARDFGDAWVHTKYKASTFLFRETKSFFRAMAGQNSEYKKLWDTYVAMGGFQSGYYDADVGVYDKRGPVRQKVGKLIDIIERVNNYVEQTPRFAEFVASVKAGNSYERALYDSAEVTTNFSRGGKLTKKLNRSLIPFLNPAVQGWSKEWRTFVDPMDRMSEKQIRELSKTSKGRRYLSMYGQLVMKVVALGLGVGVFNNLLNGGLFDEEDENYAKLPLNVKENNFLIPTANGKFIKIPKGRVVALYSQMTTRIIEYTNGEEDALNAWDWFTSYWDMMSPIDAASRTIFAPIGDAIANRTWYGTAIESRTMEQMYEAKDRYDESTSSIAIAIGQAINVSPKKVHYLIEQYTGFLGDVFLPMTTEKAEQGLFSANFITDPEYTNDISSKYYDIKDEITYAKNSGDLNALMAYKYLNAHDNLLSDIYKAKRDIANYNTMSEEEKALLISSLPQLSKALNLSGKVTLTDAEKREYTSILQSLLNGTITQVTDNIEAFQDIIISADFAGEFSKFIYSDMYKKFDESKKNLAYNKAMDYYYALYMSQMNGVQLNHKYALYEAVGANETCLYLAEISKIESDKDKDGNTINGSRKEKVHKYIQGLKLTAQQKYILMYLAGYTPTEAGKKAVEGYLKTKGYTAKEIKGLWN